MDKDTPTSDTNVTTHAPASKRKADDEAPQKKVEKRGRVSYTPTGGPKCMKRTTPARARSTSTAQMPGEEPAHAESTAVTEKLFKNLGDSLTASLTKKMSDDFKSTMTGVNQRIDTNAKSVGDLGEAIRRLEENTALTQPKNRREDPGPIQ